MRKVRIIQQQRKYTLDKEDIKKAIVEYLNELNEIVFEENCEIVFEKNKIILISLDNEDREDETEVPKRL